jgi:hypothetical protein
MRDANFVLLISTVSLCTDNAQSHLSTVHYRDGLNGTQALVTTEQPSILRTKSEVLSPPPCQPPPEPHTSFAPLYFASTALFPLSPPQSIKIQRFYTPLNPPFLLIVSYGPAYTDRWLLGCIIKSTYHVRVLSWTITHFWNAPF